MLKEIDEDNMIELETLSSIRNNLHIRKVSSQQYRDAITKLENLIAERINNLETDNG